MFPRIKTIIYIFEGEDMRKPFVSLLANGRYRIGCTGQTVYVLDAAGRELARFRDMTYAYYAALHPGGEIAAVYSNNGVMAVYSLSQQRLIRKFRVSTVNDTQTNRIPCFSPDGKYLYHIEGRKGDALNNRLSVYSTVDYRPVLRLFEEGPKTVFECMEFDTDTAVLFLLGYFRYEDRNDHFVARLIERSLQDIRPLDYGTYISCQSAIHIKQMGFTEEAFRWSYIAFMPGSAAHPERTPGSSPGPWSIDRAYTLDDLKQMDLSLARLWKEKAP